MIVKEMERLKQKKLLNFVEFSSELCQNSRVSWAVFKN